MKLFSNPRLRTILKQIIVILLPIFSTAFLLGTTVLIIVVMKGYSIDVTKKEIIKTGVLNIETNPADAEIIVNNQSYGKSNKAIPNLRIGTYTVTLKHAGYYPYTRSVEILHGLASPIIVPLLREAGAAKLKDITKETIVDANKTGYYLLEEIPEQTVTPTPTKAVTPKVKNYLLTHVYITKPFFDDPKAALDETMIITTFATTPITSISVSPTGKLILATLQDTTSGTASLSLLPFKKGTTVNGNLTDSKSLTFYKKDKNTKITWSSDGDYILVETPTQVISYNTKTATKIIVIEKTELQIEKDVVVWNRNEAGISLAKKAQGTDTRTYDLQQITYNGNPLSVTIPTIPLPAAPTKIWSFGTQQRPVFVIATSKGTYVLGKLFDTKASEFDVNLATEKINETPIANYAEDFSLFKVSETNASMVLDSPTRYAFVIISEDQKTADLFTYNRRAADHITTLGTQKLASSATAFDSTYISEDGFYFSYTTGKNLYTVDVTGQNTYSLQYGVSTPITGQNDTALLYTGDDKNLYFKILR